MKIIVLGSAAGGGFPAVELQLPQLRRRAQRQPCAPSRAPSRRSPSAGNGVDWVLFNASPDILAQIRASPALQPARAVRDTGIAAVVLMDGQIDHATGLFMLRERGTPLPL